MPVYSVASTANGVFLNTGTSIATYFSSFLNFGEATSAIKIQAVLEHNTGSGGTTASQEKFNSRSPAASGDNYSAFQGGSGVTFVIFAIADFSHFGWRASPRYYPVVFGTAIEGGANNGIFTTSASTSSTACFSEDNRASCNRLRRRSTKPGYFQRFGSEIHHHQKTGGGAFSQICPHFDNDITWIDPSAWRNGMTQNEVWEMNLFGPQAPFSKNSLVSQAVSRASHF